jgi:hypothetical protein
MNEGNGLYLGTPFISKEKSTASDILVASGRCGTLVRSNIVRYAVTTGWAGSASFSSFAREPVQGVPSSGSR